MKKSYILILLFVVNSLNAQIQRRLIAYDLMEHTVDTLDLVDFDNSVTADNTDFYIGNFSKKFSPLNTDVPQENVYPNSHFTKRQHVTDFYNLEDFPIRTSIKLYRFGIDSIPRQVCSGSIVSSKHVLTSGHCVFRDIPGYDIEPAVANYFVSPVFDEGNHNDNFECSWVKKIYRFDYPNISNCDIALLELETPIGNSTGWLGMGFEQDNTILKDGIFYKFSYPGVYMPEADSVHYNGDTLYFSYGVIDYLYTGSIGIINRIGIVGESGSSIIKVENKQKYITYGNLNTSTNSVHLRIQNNIFYPFKSVIEPYLQLSINEGFYEPPKVLLHPNPATDMITCQLPEFEDVKLQIYDLQGEKIYEEHRNNTNRIELNVSLYSTGIYFVIILSKKNKYINKFLKK